MLASDDISEALAVIGCYATQEIAGNKGVTWAYGVRTKLKDELKRRRSGPLNMLEAVASKMPFRRLAWSEHHYYRLTHRATAGRTNDIMFECVDDGPNEYVSFDDVLAGDYVLQARVV